jgi:nucleoid-associated protein YgaU
MARAKSAKTKKATLKKKVVPVKASRTERVKNPSLTERIQTDIAQNNSLLNLILGALILVVLGVLIFNYFSGDTTNQGVLEPAQQTQNEGSVDVTKENLPGPYTVKSGDTLYSIAQNYYGNGFLYPTIVEQNKLSSENIEVGQTITIPKVEDGQMAQASATPAPTDQSLLGSQPEAPTAPEAPSVPTAPAEHVSMDQGTGGAENQTIWGERINGNTYTVQSGDWLSTIAGRAYGDALSYEKLAKANNIQNPDLIEPGTVLQIPR